MPDVTLLLALFAAVYFGFAALAMSQDRHWHLLGGVRRCPRRAAVVLRIVGYALLVAALAVALARDGVGFGSVLWATTLTVGALCVVATLSWRAQWLRPLARLVQLIG